MYAMLLVLPYGFNILAFVYFCSFFFFNQFIRGKNDREEQQW